LRAAVALGVAVLAGVGCKELPEIPAGVCGNRVLEPPEDCDGFDIDGVPCRPPGGVDACRLDCSANESGEAAACPSGWGCVEGRVCRQATGDFVETGEPIPGSAWSLTAGDFDGDGHGDVLSVERPLALGITKSRIHFLGNAGDSVETYVSEKPMAAPFVSNITSDERSDVAYSFGNVNVLAGEANRSMLSETYPSYFVGDAQSLSVFVTESPVDKDTPIAVFGRLDGADGIFVFDESSPNLRLIAELEAGVEDFVSDPVLGDFFEDNGEFPCSEIAVAFRGASELSVYSLCDAPSPNGELGWRDEAYVEVVPLDPPAPIAQSLVTTDLDGDGHLDIIVGTETGPYAAFGDGGRFDSARPHSFTFFDEIQFIAPDAAPLAAGDMTGDGRPDFVFPQGLVFSWVDPETDEPGYKTIRQRFGVPWSEALFADVNADGELDLACASNAGLDIDFFLGTGTIAINSYTVSTERPTENLIVHDLDGDLVNDLVFTELRRTEREPEQVSIAFGRRSGGPESPVPAAHLEDVDHLAAFPDDPTSTVANVIISFSQKDDQGNREHAIGFIVGSSDRRPSSPIELSTFSVDGSVETSTSVMVTVGSFLREDQIDVVPFGLKPKPPPEGEEPNFEDADPEMWLIQDIPHKSHAPERFGWPLDPKTRPLGGPSGTREVSARLAPADLDGDGIDEVVFVAPSQDGAECIVNVAGVAGEPPVLELLDVVALDLPCYETTLAIADLDTDGALDISVLAGEPENTRGPVVLWNDGRGDFDAEEATSAAAEGESATAFTTFHAFDGTITLAYVTESSVRLLKSRGHSRAFDDEELPLTLTQGTGIVATDVDGDGIVDLAVADSGNIHVLRAELAR
jgi:hypothetical protein